MLSGERLLMNIHTIWYYREIEKIILELQWTLFTTAALVPKDVVVKMNLLLYRLLK